MNGQLEKFSIKSQTPAARCDVCHQADLFDPATGVCTRCAGITPPLSASPPLPGIRFTYTGPNRSTIWFQVRNFLIGDAVGAVVCGFPFLYANTLGPHPIAGMTIPVLVLSIQCLLLNGILGFLVGRRIRKSGPPFSVNGLMEAANRFTATPSLILFFLNVVLGFPLLDSRGYSPGMTLFGFVIPAFLTPFLYVAAGLATTRILFALERANLTRTTQADSGPFTQML